MINLTVGKFVHETYSDSNDDWISIITMNNELEKTIIVTHFFCSFWTFMMLMNENQSMVMMINRNDESSWWLADSVSSHDSDGDNNRLW